MISRYGLSPKRRWAFPGSRTSTCTAVLAVTSRWTTALPTRPVAPITVMVKKDPPKHLGSGIGSPSVSEEGVVPHDPRSVTTALSAGTSGRGG